MSVDHRHSVDVRLFNGLRQISVETVVSTPPCLPFANPSQPHFTEDHQAFKYLQQLKASPATAVPSALVKDGSLFSIQSAPPLADTNCIAGLDTPAPQSRPVSLALDPNTMLAVQFAQPTTVTVEGITPGLAQSDDVDEEENENLWTVSSLTARPLIAKSKELRFMGKSKINGGRAKRTTTTGKSDDGTSVGGVSKGSSDFTAIDGGYGWLVVFGAFSVQFWVAGLVKSYGVLYVEILENFPNASAAVASWIPAILSALCLVLAPVSSALSQRFSCRLVVFVGGIFCALGLTLSYFATNLVHLFFSFGVLTGIGGGLSTTPGIIIVSQYFDRRRALANGICVSGTAAGSFVFPILIDRLVHSFGFHGTILILGGCMLHVCISATLYRPPVLDLATDEGDTSSSKGCNLRSVETTQTLISQNSSVLGTYLSASAEEPLNSSSVGSAVPGKRIFIENLFLEEARNRLDELAQNNKLGELGHLIYLKLSDLLSLSAPEATKLDISDDEGKDFMGETLVMKQPSGKCKCTRSSSVYLHSVEDLSTDSTFVYKKRGSGHESNRGSRKR